MNQMKTEFILEPRYVNQKSFYKKARIVRNHNTGIVELISYRTVVAQINYSEDAPIATVYGTYSNTTLKHIKEFLLQHGFDAPSKKFIEQNYMDVM